MSSAICRARIGWHRRETMPPCVHAQALAENAVLARTLVEGVGALARALGPRFAARGALMYTVLIPLFERLADPCPSVAAAAHTAVDSLCLHCGYSGLDALVGACLGVSHRTWHCAAHTLPAALSCAEMGYLEADSWGREVTEVTEARRLLRGRNLGCSSQAGGCVSKLTAGTCASSGARKRRLHRGRPVPAAAPPGRPPPVRLDSINALNFWSLPLHDAGALPVPRTAMLALKQRILCCCLIWHERAQGSQPVQHAAMHALKQRIFASLPNPAPRARAGRPTCSAACCAAAASRPRCCRCWPSPRAQPWPASASARGTAARPPLRLFWPRWPRSAPARPPMRRRCVRCSPQPHDCVALRFCTLL